MDGRGRLLQGRGNATSDLVQRRYDQSGVSVGKIELCSCLRHNAAAYRRAFLHKGKYRVFEAYRRRAPFRMVLHAHRFLQACNNKNSVTSELCGVFVAFVSPVTLYCNHRSKANIVERVLARAHNRCLSHFTVTKWIDAFFASQLCVNRTQGQTSICCLLHDKTLKNLPKRGTMISL